MPLTGRTYFRNSTIAAAKCTLILFKAVGPKYFKVGRSPISGTPHHIKPRRGEIKTKKYCLFFKVTMTNKFIALNLIVPDTVA